MGTAWNWCALVFLAGNPRAPLEQVPGLGQNGWQRLGPGLRSALREGLSAPEAQRPPGKIFERLSQEQSNRFSRLKDWRASLGVRLSLDPSLLWPMVSLERLARAPHSLPAELESPDIRRWQCEEFGPALASMLASLA